MGEDEAGEHGGEEGEGGDARREETQVPEEVDHRRGHRLLLLLGEEVAQRAVVRGHTEGNG